MKTLSTIIAILWMETIEVATGYPSLSVNNMVRYMFDINQIPLFKIKSNCR